eukprot:1665251-Alexandrium_andersonii.AAC.1
MSASLVGSEMCIRDSALLQHVLPAGQVRERRHELVHAGAQVVLRGRRLCLLYTSDAADDM